jgi:hypothetical protein
MSSPQYSSEKKFQCITEKNIDKHFVIKLYNYFGKKSILILLIYVYLCPYFYGVLINIHVFSYYL